MIKRQQLPRRWQTHKSDGERVMIGKE